MKTESPDSLLDLVRPQILQEYTRRENICESFLGAGAFMRDLSAVEVQGMPTTWRII